MSENGAKIGDLRQWFAMRVTFRRELNVKQMLDAKHIENYIPMRRVTKVVRGRKMNLMAPVIHNLIFVHAEKQQLQEFKATVPYLQYMTVHKSTGNEPIVVPDRQMDDFMAVSSSDDSNITYFETGVEQMSAGTPVRIHGGAFDGLTGSFVKVKGKRSKQVVVAIQNVLAVAIDAFNYDYMEILK